MEKYKNKLLSIDVRIEDLLSQMTLKEKIGQLNQKMLGWKAYKKTEEGIEITEDFKAEVAFGDGLGALYGLFRADPWSTINFDNGIPLEQNAKVANMIQRYVIENTRLGIPILFSEECPHGHQALDSTIFPTNLGVGSTWNPGLYEKAFSQVAAEIRARGGNLGLVSTLDILQDPRWGRSEECYGEDPFLSAKLGAAAVRGLQGNTKEDLKRSDKVVAVVKHLCAQGASVGGHNGKGSPIGERELREIHLSGMKAAVDVGAMSCMGAYNEIDGVYCHANRKLLSGILRDEWGFEGVVMSDGGAIDNLVSVAGDYEKAAAMALKAGVDLNLWSVAFTHLESSVHKGIVSEDFVDRAVRRILKLKFMLGIFENPYTDEKKASYVVNNEEAKEINLKVAREAVVMLKNNNILPLKKQINRIAVIGPNGDNLYNQLGDYTSPQREHTGVTIFQGIKSLVAENTEVTYSKGCGIRDISKEGFRAAIENARNADVVILALGGSSTRDFNIKFADNGAAIVTDILNEMDCGEGADVADLELGGVQVDLAKELLATGKPVVVVLIQGRPHAIPWISENCDAVLCGWYPGKEGGRAIAEIIFGDVNPSGKLPVSIPKASAQLPVYYNYKDTSNYIDMTAAPLYPFGFGLSYTNFEYSNLNIQNKVVTASQLETGETVKINVNIKNIGDKSGAEVVQLYIKDLESSVNRRVKELKGFHKVWLKASESKIVTFELGKEELAVWNSEMEFIVEQGNVEIMVGKDSTTDYKTILRII